MVNNNYLYLGEQNIGIEGPAEVLGRIDRNFEERPTNEGNVVGHIDINEGEYVKFSRDRSKPYLATKPNNSRSYPGVDFLRYGVCVSSLWSRDPLHYEVMNFLSRDETGALKCFKKVYYSTASSKNKTLIHGSLVEVGGKGILVVGGCWSGKTSLTLGFLEKLKGRLVSDGNILISKDNKMVGHYLPRPVYIRFYSISTNERLAVLLNNPLEAEAIQPFDEEAIQEIISQRKYEIDGGLNISRKKFSELMGIESMPSRRIDKIVHCKFSDQPPSISPIKLEESYHLLLTREFPKDVTIGNVKHQRDIKSPQNSIIKPNWLEGLKIVMVSFDARKHLTQSLLEDLL